MTGGFRITHTLKPAGPGPLRLVGNALRALGDTVASLADGKPLTVGDAEKTRRRAACDACEAYYDAEAGRCLHPACGCFLRAKTWLTSQRCPAGEW